MRRQDVFRRDPRRVGEGLLDIGRFQIRVVPEDISRGVSRSHQLDDDRHGNAHATDARLATHHIRLLGDAIELPHVRFLIKIH